MNARIQIVGRLPVELNRRVRASNPRKHSVTGLSAAAILVSGGSAQLAAAIRSVGRSGSRLQ